MAFNRKVASSSQRSVPGSSHSYTLRRYSWRAFLGVTGPLLLVGFYAFISFYYLDRQPQNGILPDGSRDANAPFYAWFVVSILTLEWARTALANVLAAALMSPAFAPADASGLFWFADDNWANILWWFRALRNMVLGFLVRKGSKSSISAQTYQSTPNLLWTVLSVTSLLIFVAVPLSGLTMEITPVLHVGRRQATIIGPTARSFQEKARYSLSPVIEGTWKAGGAVTPPDASYFYAPDGTVNVSLTYLEDMIVEDPDRQVTTFLGPAVNSLVAGTSFGMENTFQCRTVSASDLKLIDVHDWGNYNLTYSSAGSVSTNSSSKGTAEGRWSGVFLNETRVLNSFGVGTVSYSFIAVADGSWNGNSPYSSASNGDFNLFNSRPDDQETGRRPNGLLEFYLWQDATDADDAIFRSLVTNDSSFLTKAPSRSGPGPSMVGFATQCTVSSAVGYAQLNPKTRTYSGFQITNTTGLGGDNAVWGPQILAVMALSDYDPVSYAVRQVIVNGAESRWVSLHQGIGFPASEVCISDCDTPDSDNFGTGIRYLTLKPANVTFALYRLLGQSVVATMGGGSQDPYEAELYLLDSARWLKPGPVPWQLVLALLALWATIVMGLSLWTLTTKRWAPTLSGFELFRFGAQYTEEINQCRSHRFEACDELTDVPGMVGVLPGGAAEGLHGFIGLSRVRAKKNSTYTFDRKQAARHPGP
jgi:hypothetical protein